MPNVGVYEMTDTWSVGATTYKAVAMDVTDTSSAAGSLLLDLLIGGVSKFSVSKAGNTTIAGTLSVTGAITATGGVTGNASTATALATARTINGVAFDGTANVTVADATKLPLSGGTMTGAITFGGGQTWPTFNQNTTGSAASLSSTLAVTSGGTGQTTYTDGQLLIGNSSNNSLSKATLTAGPNVIITNGNGTITIESTGGGGGVSSVGQSFTGGLISVAGSPITTSGTLALTVDGNSGGIPYFSGANSWASSAALAANSLVIGGGAGAAPSTTTTGTGVLAALGLNTGTAGAFVVQDGALGTPSSGTVTNLTGTAAININGTVGATTPATGAFTTLSASGTLAVTGNVSSLVASFGEATAGVNSKIEIWGNGTGRNHVLSAQGSTGIGIGTGSGNTPILLYAGATTGAVQGVRLYSGASFSWTDHSSNATGGTQDLMLLRDAAGVLALRNGVNAQTLRLYNTFTDASNYERGFLRWSSNVFEIGHERAGTGAKRSLKLDNVTITSHTPFAITAVDTTNDTITVPGHDFVVTDTVRFTAVGSIGGVNLTTNYNVLTVSGDVLTLAAHASGNLGTTAVNLTGSLGTSPAIVRTQTHARIEMAATEGGSICLVAGSGGGVAFRRITGSHGNGNGGANPLGGGAIDLQTGSQSGSQCASGASSAILGGVNNSATGNRSVVVGGIGNGCSGSEAIVLGGESNNAASQASVASGRFADSTRYGQRAHANTRFGSSGRDNTDSAFMLYCKTTAGTATEMFLDNSAARLTIASGVAHCGTVRIVGVTSGNEKTNIYLRQYAIKNRGGTTALEGSVQTIGTDIEGLDVTGPTITANDTNDALKIEVTGFDPVTGITATASTDVFAKTAHGFAVNDDIVFTAASTNNEGFTINTTTYWVIEVADANSFKVSATRGGASINITSDLTDITATRLMRWVAVVNATEISAGV